MVVVVQPILWLDLRPQPREQPHPIPPCIELVRQQGYWCEQADRWGTGGGNDYQDRSGTLGRGLQDARGSSEPTQMFQKPANSPAGMNVEVRSRDAGKDAAGKFLPPPVPGTSVGGGLVAPGSFGSPIQSSDKPPPATGPPALKPDGRTQTDPKAEKKKLPVPMQDEAARLDEKTKYFKSEREKSERPAVEQRPRNSIRQRPRLGLLSSCKRTNWPRLSTRHRQN